MTTIRDVAKEAGVSVATVSRVINDKKVSVDTKIHVENIMRKLNYIPSNVARSLTSKKSNTIALIIPALNNPFFPNLANSLEIELHKHGYNVLLYSISGEKNKLIRYIDDLIKNLVDGIIIDSHLLNDSDIKYIKGFKIPMVSIDRLQNSNFITTVSVNNIDGASKATQHLIDVGSKRIGHLRGTSNEITSDQRFWGYRKIVKEYDWFNSSWIAQADFSVEGGYRALKELLNRHEDIDGVFAANDLSAIGALKAATEFGIKVPDELAVIGFDGIDMTKYMIPTISTVIQPIKLMCELAVKELLKEINGVQTDTHNHEFDVTLQINESTMR